VSVSVFQLDAALELRLQAFALALQTFNAVLKIHAQHLKVLANVCRKVLALEPPIQAIVPDRLIYNVALAALSFVILTAAQHLLQEQNRRTLFIRTLVILLAVQGLGQSTHMAIVAKVMAILTQTTNAFRTLVLFPGDTTP